MILILDKQNKIEFRNDPDGDWFGTFSINNIMHEFSFKNHETLDWEEIKTSILYFIKYHVQIINLTNQGIENYIKSTLGWEFKIEYDLECVTVLNNHPTENIFIFHPLFFDDPYVSWSAHIYDHDGPKLRKVVRE